MLPMFLLHKDTLLQIRTLDLSFNSIEFLLLGLFSSRNLAELSLIYLNNSKIKVLQDSLFNSTHKMPQKDRYVSSNKSKL